MTLSECYLDKHLGSWGELSNGFQWDTEAAHRLAVTRELERKVFLPLTLYELVASGSLFLLGHATLADIVDIHLLAQHSQSSLGSLTDLLVACLRLYK